MPLFPLVPELELIRKKYLEIGMGFSVQKNTA